MRTKRNSRNIRGKKRWTAALLALLLLSQTVTESVSVLADNAISQNTAETVYAEGAVTYNQLENYLTDVKIMDPNFTENWEGGTVLDQSKQVGIEIDFVLPPSSELSLTRDNCFFRYDLGKVVAIKGGTESEKGALDLESLSQANGSKMTGDVVNRDGQKVGTYVLGTNGIVEMDFTYAIDNNLLATVYSMQGYFQFSCAMNEDAFGEDQADYVLKFTTKDGVNPTITVDDKKYLDRDVEVAKTGGTVDLNEHTARYEITVKNTGKDAVDDITIHDVMGSNLSYDATKTGSITGVTATPAADGVKFTIASLAPGDVKTIVYYAKIADGAYDGNSGNLGNKLTATVKKNGEDRPIYITDSGTTQTPEVVAAVNKDVLQKGGVNNGDGTITWTIRVNQGSTPYDISGLKISDVLAQTPVGQTFASDIVIVNDRTSEELDRISKAALTGDSFEYTFPTGSAVTDSFTITYTTQIGNDFAGEITLINNVSATEEGKTTPIDQEVGKVTATNSFLSKSAIAYDDADEFKFRPANPPDQTQADVVMRWKSVIKIPALVPAGQNLVYKDSFNPWSDNLDEFKLNGTQADVEIRVNNALVDPSNYTITTDSQSYGDTFEVTFNNTFLQNNAGKEIELIYETIGNMDGSKSRTFTNHASVAMGEAKESASATRTITVQTDETYVEKKVSQVDAKNHSVTWCVRLNSNEWNTVAIKKNWAAVKITDVVENMKFYGYKSGSEDWQGSVYITNGHTYTYRLNADGITVNTSAKNAAGDYTTTITFDFSKAKKMQAWGDDYPEYLTAIKETDTVNLYYTTVLDEEDYAKHNCETTYSNRAEFEGKDTDNNILCTDTADATATMQQEVISKSQGIADALDGRRLHYTIDINPDAIKLSKGANTCYRVEDLLPDDLLYVADSLQVINTETGVALSQDADVDGVVDSSHYEFSIDGNTLILMVPDEVALTMKYEVYTLGQKGKQYTYVNSVVIPQPYVEEESQQSSSTNRQIAGTNAGLNGNIVFYIDKVNANKPSQRLEGATFEAKEWVYDQTTGAWSESGNVFSATTGASGILNSLDDFRLKSDPTSAVRIEQNKIYEIRETDAPDGYAKSGKVYKIFVHNASDVNAPPISSLPAGTTVAMAGIRYLYENTQQNLIKVAKRYYDQNDTKITNLTDADARAVLHIYKGKYTLEQCEANVPAASLDLTKPASAAALGVVLKATKGAEGEEYALQNLSAGIYTVYEESAPDGYKKLDNVYYFTVLDDGTIRVADATTGLASVSMEVKNEKIKLRDNRFEINKTYYDYNGAELTDVSAQAQAVFYIKKTKDETGAAVTQTPVKMSNKDAKGLVYYAENLEQGTYEVTEAVSDIYNQDSALPLTIVVSAEGNITITSAVSPASKLTGNGTTDVKVALDNEMKNPINEIEIRKQYKKPGGELYTSASTTDPNGISVTINKYIGETEFVLEKKNGSGSYAEVSGVAITLTLDAATGNAATAIIKNLEPGEYRISEKQTPDGFFVAPAIEFIVGNDYHVEYNATRSLTQTMEFVNQQYENQPCRIQFVKSYLDHDGNEVSGDLPVIVYATNTAVLDAVTKDNYNPSSTDYATLPASGILDTVNAGNDYYFKEVSGKDGYRLFSGYVKVAIEVVGSAATITEVSYIGSAAENPIVSTSYTNTQHDSVMIQVKNLPNTNKLTITKEYYEVDGTTLIPYAQLSEYAQFTLYRKESKTASDATYADVSSKFTATGAATGSYVISGLNPGYYKLEETTVPAGFGGAQTLCFEVNDHYEIENAVTVSGGVEAPVTLPETTVAGGKEYTYTAKNTRLSNRFEITKEYVDYSGNVLTTPPSLGATFTVAGILPTSYTATTMTYDSGRGVYEINNLPDGTYQVTETAPDGFTPADEVRLTVNGGKIYALYTGTVAGDCVITGNRTTTVSAAMKNHPKTNKLELVKAYKDANGNTLVLSAVPERAVFYIEKESATTGMYDRIGTMYRSALVYTYGKLEPGNYRIVEVVPEGFEPDIGWTGNAKLFTVSSEYEIKGLGTDGYTVSIDAENKRKGNVFRLTKTYRDADGGDIAHDTVADKPQFTVKQSGVTVASMTYDAGANLYTVTNLLPGTYEIEETYTPNGFEKAGNIKLVVAQNGTIRATYLGTDASFTGGNTALVTGGNLVNRALSVSIMIQKKYQKDGSQMSYGDVKEYAKFYLYKNRGAVNETDVTSKVVEVDKTTGSYRIIDLSPGTYTLVEKDNPYFEPMPDITFTVSTGGVITGLGSATKIDTYVYSLEINNVHKDNKITIRKKYYDNANALVTGISSLPAEELASFTLYRIEGSSRVKVDAVDATDMANGIYTIEDIPEGVYEIAETPGSGYKSLAGVIKFRVDADWNIQFDPTTDSCVDLSGATGNDNDQTVEVSNYKGNLLSINKKFYDWKGNEVADTAAFKLWSVTASSFAPGTDKPVAVSENGVSSNCVGAAGYTFTKQPDGRYAIKEIVPGKYVITEESSEMYETPYPYWYIYFEVDASGMIKNLASYYDDPAWPMFVTAEYGDDTTGVKSSKQVTVSLRNKRKKGANLLKVTKQYVDADGKNVTTDDMLSKTEFELEKQDKTKISLVYDAAEKVYKTSSIPEGTYTLKEIRSVDGYETGATVVVKVDADAVIALSYVGEVKDCKLQGSGTSDGRVTIINREKPEEPDDPEKPGKPGKPGTPGSPSAPPTDISSNSKTDSPKLVKTGDTAPIIPVAIMAGISLAMAAACLWMLLKNRKKK